MNVHSYVKVSERKNEKHLHRKISSNTDVFAYSFFSSSIIATALIQPALAFLILTG
ncbi:hypothetical protein [Enterococcus lactis]|uniref:hypothetical protein n=1 Tax=Enterococcus lactis TaxID=357441 RepID=UPI0001B6CB3B|nr:hypothetical protein [Enterococcus lactis]EEV49899.1 predicted protein [Enterococcus faecium 1,141,733]EEV58470.1 predicted protein [Enterococcus faecium Com12]MDB7501638.1 hypothetical protein [Enterococcus faecium]MBL4989950.1 hypothetical protein [Enterococcus lactis]MBL4993069.1 hypothetical protein [Enterococcus lactis]